MRRRVDYINTPLLLATFFTYVCVCVMQLNRSTTRQSIKLTPEIGTNYDELENVCFVSLLLFFMFFVVFFCNVVFLVATPQIACFITAPPLFFAFFSLFIFFPSSLDLFIYSLLLLHQLTIFFIGLLVEPEPVRVARVLEAGTLNGVSCEFRVGFKRSRLLRRMKVKYTPRQQWDSRRQQQEKKCK